MANHSGGRSRQLVIGTTCLVAALAFAVLAQHDYQRHEFRLALSLAFLAEALLFLVRWEQPRPWCGSAQVAGLVALPTETRLFVLSEVGIANIGFVLAGNLSLWFLVPLIAAGCNLAYVVMWLRRIRSAGE